ncbi:MAG: helix-turn-helix domain-containing protein [Dehalococcoidia bacterium]
MTAIDAVEFLTVAEAAKLLRVSTVTMHRWLKQGRLPAYHVGPRAVRIRRQDLDAIITPLESLEVYPREESWADVVARVNRPMSPEEVQRGWATLERSRRLREAMLARRGGQPFEESWPMINAARDQRSKEI